MTQKNGILFRMRNPVYLINLLNDYYKDLVFCRNSNIKLFNFWPLENPTDLWLHKFISYRNLIPKNKSISIYSVHGDRKKIKLDLNRNKIFYTGENPDYINSYHDYCLSDVKLALGFDYLNHEHYLRLPIWYLFFVKYDLDLIGIKEWLNKIELTNRNRSFQNRKFCSMVASHDSNGLRTKLFNLLNCISNIDSGGMLLKNNDDINKLYNNDKIRFIENYKFNICLENSDRLGYVTEKIFHSIIAGCLPIYWGGDNLAEKSILNQERILYLDPSNMNQIFNKVEELYNSPKLLLDFYNQGVFLKGAAEHIYDTLIQLEEKVKAIF